MRRGRLRSAVAGAAVLLALGGSPVLAEGGSEVNNSGGIDSEITVTNDPYVPDTDTGGYDPAPDTDTDTGTGSNDDTSTAEENGWDPSDGPMAPCLVEGSLQTGCEVDDDEDDPGGGGVVQPINSAVLAESIVSHMDLPAPRVHVSPGPPNPTYVNFFTWYWVSQGQWQPHSKSISLRGTTVTVTIEPVRTTWVTGEDASVSCGGPGEVWEKGSPEESSCGHAYETTGKKTVSASIGWHASWTCSGVCVADGGDFGVMESDSGSSPLEVRQRQSLVIG